MRIKGFCIALSVLFACAAAAVAQESGAITSYLKGLRAGAEKGDADAQYHLGAMYMVGRGVPQDYTQAVKWFRLAASKQSEVAQRSLGFAYKFGQGVSQDYTEAARWFRLAADQGEALAQEELGAFYANGQGVPKDYVRAHMWLNLSAAQGNQLATKYRTTVSNYMTPEQIAEAQRLAGEWKPGSQLSQEHQAGPQR